jgi:hypothetical protein
MAHKKKKKKCINNKRGKKKTLLEEKKSSSSRQHSNPNEGKDGEMGSRVPLLLAHNLAAKKSP